MFRTSKIFTKKFMRREDGTATVEFAIWMPFVFAVFLAAGELVMIFYGQSRILQVAQDATRQASIGRLQTAEDVSNYINTELPGFATNASITNQVSRGVITTAVSVPVRDIAPFGIITALGSSQVTVVAQQVAEY